MSDVWPFVHAERRALVEDLAPLSDEQWRTPSLCAGWTVEDVVAHVVDTARTSRLRFAREMLRHRFDFDRQNERGMQRFRGTTPAETLDGLRAAVDLRLTPPAPLDTRLVEAIVHGEDVRRPLGLVRDYDTEAVVAAFRWQARTSPAMGGAKAWFEGLSLRATDADLVHGSGPEVAGPALELLLASCGRAVALDALSGPGVATLAERIA
ncbi:maleylpyruvate isomerase family mycothiol-dependent enzyme [Nocardioides sp. LML1-1-1.1]|uniref:maleylpyruvate isomerase family mycothiol-dependent enzyme n=1 Tax=Nocardioides sp. LML1-1-1.1 TaxID=3135248 RepID=UPI003447CD21